MSPSCPCGANCQPRKLPDWLLAQLADARRGLVGVAGVFTNGFCCPLCARVLPTSCATVAHAPSKEVGGGAQTFLCKACNSFLGTAYEAGADSYISAIEEAKASGASTTKITLTNRQGTRLFMDGVFSGGRGNKRIEGKARGRNKAAAERFSAERKEGDPLFLGFQVPGEETIKLAYLSWAYLLLFRRLGYAFVFSVAGRDARSALLGGSVKALSPAFFFTYGEFKGEASPVAVGLLVRMEKPDFESAPPVALAAEIGSSVVSLRLGDDPEDRYGQVLDYTADGSKLLVLPFEVIYPDHLTAMPGLAAYRWQSKDGTLHRVLAIAIASTRSDLAAATAPPTRRPRRDPLPDNPDWPPPPLPLPPEPRRETWRATAVGFLSSRNVDPRPSSSDEDDAAWIAEIEQHDPVAARHVSDMASLFRDGEDPRKFSEPRGVTVMTDLNGVAAEYRNDARVIAGDFRLVAPQFDFASLSLRLVRGHLDQVIGPHYTYRTLVFALRAALGEPAADP